MSFRNGRLTVDSSTLSAELDLKKLLDPHPLLAELLEELDHPLVVVELRDQGSSSPGDWVLGLH